MDTAAAEENLARLHADDVSLWKDSLKLFGCVFVALWIEQRHDDR